MNRPDHELCPDTSKCAYCGQPINDQNPNENSWHFHGVCDAECAGLYFASLADLNAIDANLLRSAISNMARALRRVESFTNHEALTAVSGTIP